jgi:hypothetical protein
MVYGVLFSMMRLLTLSAERLIDDEKGMDTILTRHVVFSSDGVEQLFTLGVYSCTPLLPTLDSKVE